MKKTIVYYHPRRIVTESDRGSDIRVASMLTALQQLGYHVRVIAGKAKDRHREIRQLKADIESGLTVEYVYGESTNAPIMLADKRLIPSNCYRDYSFFYWLKKRRIPLGIFYRDIYWHFGFLKQQLPWPLNILLKPLYYLDWSMYDKFCDTLFLPSETMNLHLPRTRVQGTFQALPPGFDVDMTPRHAFDETSAAPLRLLYVGGIEPTIYDISQLMQIVMRRQDVQLTICCRSDEWKRHRHRYQAYMSENIHLAHVNREGLESYYHSADLFVMLMSYSDYMDFAMPVKLFESIGYAIPIVSLDQKEVAHSIRSANIGWVLQKLEQLDGLLSTIFTNRALLSEKHRNLMAYREECSWNSRATTVNDCMKRKTS